MYYTRLPASSADAETGDTLQVSHSGYPRQEKLIQLNRVNGKHLQGGEGSGDGSYHLLEVDGRLAVRGVEC